MSDALLYQALVSAFPDRHSIAEFLAFSFDLNLNLIASDRLNLEETHRAVIEWLRRGRRESAFLEELRRVRGDNPNVRALLQPMDSSAPGPGGAVLARSLPDEPFYWSLDRDPQRSAIRDIARDPRRLRVVVIRGDEGQGHANLSAMLAALQGCPQKHIVWPPSFTGPENRLRMLVGATVLQLGGAPMRAEAMPPGAEGSPFAVTDTGAYVLRPPSGVWAFFLAMVRDQIRAAPRRPIVLRQVLKSSDEQDEIVLRAWLEHLWLPVPWTDADPPVTLVFERIGPETARWGSLIRAALEGAEGVSFTELERLSPVDSDQIARWLSGWRSARRGDPPPSPEAPLPTALRAEGEGARAAMQGLHDELIENYEDEWTEVGR